MFKLWNLPGAALIACLPVGAAWAQGPVSGTILDGRSQQGLPGATILLDGTAVGTTDARGAFQLPSVAAGAHELRVTFVGYDALNQRLSGQPEAQQLSLALQPAAILTGEAVVTAQRANDRTGTAYTNVSKQDLEKRNFGQDLPYLLDQTPSVVVTSDAGAGVGYTDIRIRGTSNTGINMTINGVPLNDPESRGSFLVNLPDLASSVSSLQVQRGVGTSQNGGAAFGASINISTLDNRREAYAESQNSYGSFNTWKNNVQFGSGLVGKYFTFDGRLSRISTDGYMKRAASDLKSYYFAAGYQQKNTLLKFITFSGREKTYQAWNGVPEPALTGNQQLLQQFVDYELSEDQANRLRTEGRRFSYYTYDNQTDNYQQNHYQLHLAQGIGGDWNLGATAHLTRGFGYYESFRANRKLVNYGLPNVTVGTGIVSRTDLVDRKWLDNYFYGGTFALNYQPKANDRLQATIGGAWNRFENDHYGEIIWARYASTGNIRQRYYFNDAEKTDYNAYARATWQVIPRLGVYADLQLRHIQYSIDGVEHEPDAARAVGGVVDVTTRADYTFFNPKAGATFTLAEGQQLYASYAVGQREPVRADFTDRPAGDVSARPERLEDFEGGYRATLPGLIGEGTTVRLEANYFRMNYRDQLVATGQLNDVGTALRTNVARSYRTGLELTAAAAWADKLSLSATATVSRNRILNFRNDSLASDVARTTTISYSPSFVGATTLEGQPLKGLRLALLGKAVSEQFLDNTASQERRIAPYQVVDFRVRYSIRPSFVKEIELGLLVNNVLNRRYATNGYTYGYPGADGQPLTFNWYFPQATRNFLASVGVKF